MPRSVDSGRSSRVNPSALDARRVVWFVIPDASRSSATDAISVGAAVDHLWPRADGTIVCLGGGGSARALCRRLFTRLARPTRILVCERDEISLTVEEARALLCAVAGDRLEALGDRGRDDGAAPWGADRPVVA